MLCLLQKLIVAENWGEKIGFSGVEGQDRGTGGGEEGDVGCLQCCAVISGAGCQQTAGTVLHIMLISLFFKGLIFHIVLYLEFYIHSLKPIFLMYNDTRNVIHCMVKEIIFIPFFLIHTCSNFSKIKTWHNDIFSVYSIHL